MTGTKIFFNQLVILNYNLHFMRTSDKINFRDVRWGGWHHGGQGEGQGQGEGEGRSGGGVQRVRLPRRGPPPLRRRQLLLLPRLLQAGPPQASQVNSNRKYLQNCITIYPLISTVHWTKQSTRWFVAQKTRVAPPWRWHWWQLLVHGSQLFSALRLPRIEMCTLFCLL